MPNPQGAPSAAAAFADDDAAADRYLEIKQSIERDPEIAAGAEFPRLRADLEAIANGAAAAPLRANAALLLGSLFEARGESKRAAGFYEHAAKLVPEDAGPHMAMAVALASTKDFERAVHAQAEAARLDPDNLENWLALGELKMRAGDRDGSVEAYIAYEQRRRGLIDGLTLQSEGVYVTSVEDRIGCAEALAAAADQGTAVALIYALRTEPEASVREAIVRVMGIHRLAAYRPVLTTQLAEESDPQVKEAVQWALAEIERAPVEIDDTERPRLAADDPRAAEGEVPRAEGPSLAPDGSNPLAEAGDGPGAAGAGATPTAGEPGAGAGAAGADAGADAAADAGKDAPRPGSAAGAAAAAEPPTTAAEPPAADAAVAK